MALGLGRATDRPAIVVVTSGTAAAQLHAAVIEADLDHVPMLVVTADRPPRLRGVGAPQTIEQVGLFGGSVRWEIDAPLPTEVEPSAWRLIANEAFAAATGTEPGPVHCNLPFDEPLVGTPGDLPAACEPPTLDGPTATSTFELPDVARGVVIAGAGIDRPGDVLEFAANRGWPILADPRSGCRTDHPVVIAHTDALVRAGSPPVEAVVRFGSLPASKVTGQWLAALDVPHVHVAPWAAVDDPDRVVTHRIIAAASHVCAGATGPSTIDPEWSLAWRRADDAIDAAIATDVATSNGSEPAIARRVVESIPEGGALVVSSSMPVRDVEWFSGRRGDLVVLSNRGANGIDGVVSTAVGVALSGVPTALLIGDVAFLHDTNGLLGLAGREATLCIVVVDNDGGGIFSFLPQVDALDGARFEQLFGTPHGVDLAGLVHAHGLPVLHSVDADAVGLAVQAALAVGGVHVVLARTDRTRNVIDHERLHDAAVAAARATGWPAIRPA